MFYEQSKLANGLQILTEPIAGVRSVTLALWFRVGSRDETTAQLGLSHFMEHMMFKGTATRTALDISTAFDGLGAELNAFTSKEYTCYHARVLDEHLPMALEILADMVQNSSFAPKAIATEREVVLEEIARYYDEPSDHVGELFTEAMHPTHALGRSVLGTRERVGSFTRKDCRAYLAQHYHAGNAVVVCAGNVDHKKLVKLCRKHLGALPRGTANARENAAEQTRELLTFETRKTEQAHLLYGMPGVPLGDPQRYAMQLLTAVLAGSMSSRLFQEVREKRGLVYAIYGENVPYVGAADFYVYAGTRPENLGEVLRIIRAEVAKLLKRGIGAEELARTREYLIGHLVLSAESTRTHMMRLGMSAVQDLEIVSLDEHIKRVRAVGAGEVMAVAERVLAAPPTVSIVSPLKKREIETVL